MAVKIRLSRIGKKHAPFFRIVAVDGRKKRDGGCLEDLGTFDALNTKLVRFKQDRLDYWVSVGAIPTDAVLKLEKMHKKESAAPVAPKVTKKTAVKPEAEKVAHEEAPTQQA